MGKLHEVLAVEKDLQGQANKILLETEKVFKAQTPFNGSFSRLVPFAEADAGIATEEHEEVVTTVEERIRYTVDFVAQWLDAVLQKEATNQTAMADIIVDGTTLATNVPATMLLGLETKLTTFRNAISAMPTLDAKRSWVTDAALKTGVWRTAHDEEVVVTRKVVEPLVLTQALIKDGVGIPAQVKEVSKDVPVAKRVKTLFSGAVTSARAAELLGRIDKLIRAVKQARQRANQAEVVSAKIGESLFGYILD